ncbi:MAG: class I SAM-dependent methyltransferase [Leptospiraceae bacterium]|nr:class I SAM-dependent methyltransferase [Leptospiraceae bacterium]
MSLFDLTEHPIYPAEYKICQKTGVHFYKNASARDYQSSYFLEEFKAQYKKTYYEDEENLRSMARRRLKILERFIQPKGKKLLEIGCAAGFFLSEAKEFGFEVQGVEISTNEADFASKLGLRIFNGSFLDFQPQEKFDIICAFFVLEHFPNQEDVWKKVFSMLQDGGFLFLGLPSLNGPTFRTNSEEWFRTHPLDHFADYDPISLASLLALFQTKIIWKMPMSYHVSRDKGWKGKFPFKYFYKTIANVLCYGDTFEVLAKQIKN